MHDVGAEYQARLQQVQSAWQGVRARRAIATGLVSGALILLLTVGLQAIRQRIPPWWAALPLPLLAAAAVRYRRELIAQSRAWRLQNFYVRASGRVQGEWPGTGDAGSEFSPRDHEYASDLGLFGEGSLFEFLSIARTAIGRVRLANYLLQPPPVEENLARQQAVRELAGRTDLREQMAMLGEFEFSEAKPETFLDWLNAPPPAVGSWLRPVFAASSALVAGLVLRGLLGFGLWQATAIALAPLLLFHAVVGLVFRKRVNRTFGSLGSLPSETRMLHDGLRLLEGQRFESPKLVQIVEQARQGVQAVRNLDRLLLAAAERSKEWFYLPSLALLGGTQWWLAMEHWRARHGNKLRGWLNAWGEFEALNALAAFAYENPDHVYPDFADGAAAFEAVALGHPLLPNQSCIRNDVTLNKGSRFYIISGSNMSGKSTLLRAIGLNAVLAYAGAPVRAHALRLAPMRICASISVVDSQMSGKSRFLVEVDRLRRTIEASANRPPVLFLIDEIFSGTNSSDRRVAAEAVVLTLVRNGAMGALSTHDMSLTEIAETNGSGGANVHMGSRDGTDPMDFDYLLKPGVTRETNALAIARMAGVPLGVASSSC